MPGQKVSLKCYDNSSAVYGNDVWHDIAGGFCTVGGCSLRSQLLPGAGGSRKRAMKKMVTTRKNNQLIEVQRSVRK